MLAHNRNVLTIFLTAMLVCIVADAAVCQKWGDVSDEEWGILPPKKFSDAAAVVLFNNGDMELSLNDIILERHVRIKIFSKDRADDITSIDITYYDSDNFKDFEAQTILSNGKKQKVEEKYEKESGSEKTLTFAFPAVEDGCILEYKYKLINHRYHFMDPWYFQDKVPTLKSRFSIVMYPGFDYRVVTSHFPAGKRKPQGEDYPILGVDVTKFTWELEDLPPAKEEPMMAAASNYLISLTFQLRSYKSPYTNYTFARSWGDLGSMYDNELEQFASAGSEIQNVASSLCSGIQVPDDKIRALYEFVRDSIETRNDEDESFVESDGARKLLAKRYGRESNKNLLLVELLKSQDVTAYPMMIGTRGYSAWNPRSKQLAQFNHLICYVENAGGGFALDTDLLSVPYPHLPPFDLVQGGLVLDGANSRAESLSHPERESGREIFSNVVISENNSAVCSTYVCLRGYELSPFDEYLHDSISSAQIAEKLTESIESNHDVVSTSASFHSEGDSLSLIIVTEVNDYCRPLGDELLVSPCVLHLAENPFEGDWRFFGVDFKYPFVRRQTTTIRLPDGMSAADLAPDTDFYISDGRYTRTTATNGADVNVIEALYVDKAVYAPGEYSDLKELFDLMTESSSHEILLTASE